MTAQQLKNSILQMAVQGKLVPQNPDDEPASVLLERIKAEKQELMKAGKIKKDKKSSEIFRGASRNFPYHFCEQIGKEIRDISDEIPFEIPEGWEWCRLGRICINIQYGTSQKSSKQGKIPVLRMGNLQSGRIVYDKLVFTSDENEIKRYPLVYDDLLFNRTNSREIVGKTSIYKGEMPAIYAGYLVRITPMINSDYLNYVMQSKYYWIYCQTVRSDAIGQSNINAEKLKQFLVPLPPLAEQHRIVTKIKELLPYIEQYEQAETKLAKLNADFPEALKKSILQEAVQGRLVPQNPDDEPASILLERIRAEKQALIKAGKIKKSKYESTIVTLDKIPYEISDGKERCIAHEVPFQLPESWEWVRFSSVINLQSGQDLTPDKYNDNELGVPYITGASNIENENIIINRWTENGRSFAYKGDILLTCKGTIGTMAILQQEQVHIARQVMAVRPYNEIYTDYIKLVLETLVESLKAAAKSMIPGIARDDVLLSLIPIPPIEEQHRIVAKIEELMPIINRISK